ncbi:hypothetical protein M427DRAFT_33876 [Gonapodya prolifera JEL478]|uniref:Uncharacterized protein n=1 Tax=Gonapodya prolifera (strain JEL478) TaxID=1344416 RepID=A0A139A9H6_GONPJ|nr:hypothetical protein M427DRAFT_33876 [Gonapodya prolifera JEL478]|eukprot:KXS13472.1 hypothetical protein M427DRAFT_33876 [Gonapodya prolifera JEL478]
MPSGFSLAIHQMLSVLFLRVSSSTSRLVGPTDEWEMVTGAAEVWGTGKESVEVIHPFIFLEGIIGLNAREGDWSNTPHASPPSILSSRTGLVAAPLLHHVQGALTTLTRTVEIKVEEKETATSSLLAQTGAADEERHANEIKSQKSMAKVATQTNEPTTDVTARCNPSVGNGRDKEPAASLTERCTDGAEPASRRRTLSSTAPSNRLTSRSRTNRPGSPPAVSPTESGDPGSRPRSRPEQEATPIGDVASPATSPGSLNPTRRPTQDPAQAEIDHKGPWAEWWEQGCWPGVPSSAPACWGGDEKIAGRWR